MYVFVYGTLKRGFINYPILEKTLEEVGYIEVKTVDKYPMYKSESYFPYLENKKGEGKRVKGHLYKVKNSEKWRLEQFEGVPKLYKNGLIDVEDEDGNFYASVGVFFRSKNEVNLDFYELLEEWKEEDPRKELKRKIDDMLGS